VGPVPNVPPKDQLILRGCTLLMAAAKTAGCGATIAGMTFWTDAAILGAAGIPSVLFGPGGAGLHSIEEYVILEDVLRCRDALANLARSWCAP